MKINQIPGDKFIKSLMKFKDPKFELERVMNEFYKKTNHKIFLKKWKYYNDDIATMASDIAEVLNMDKKINGVLFFFDILNNENGYNVTVNISKDADFTGASGKWVYNSTLAGGILIEEFTHINEDLSKYSDDVRMYLDYTVQIIYGGLVIVSALKISPCDRDLIIGFGFHDGDVFYLAKIEKGEIIINPFPNSSLM